MIGCWFRHNLTGYDSRTGVFCVKCSKTLKEIRGDKNDKEATDTSPTS